MKRPKVAVILAGCGFKDGAEIRESVLTLLGLDLAGADFQCLAPDKEFDEVDHLTSKPTGKRRSLLAEAARIARGKILPLAQASSKDFDAVVLPGGFGAATNLCTFAKEGANCHVDPSVEKFLEGFIAEKKPIGGVCIAPALLAKVFQKHGGVKLTIGDDPETAKLLEAMGSQHIKTAANDIAVDSDRKVVTTPAYMYGEASLSEISRGIEKLAKKVVQLAT
jgi:enhancing lycopene biosynthesis protein 2